MRSFELEEYSPLLSAIESPDLDLILVGGHAVSVYAHRYRRTCPALDVYLPFRSKDADLVGTVASGMQLASRLTAQWKREPTKGGMKGLSIGHIELPGVPGAKVEILGHQWSLPRGGEPFAGRHVIRNACILCSLTKTKLREH